MNIQGLWDGAYGLSPLSEKIVDVIANSCLKTLSVGSVGVELTTFHMAAPCSTNWATTHQWLSWLKDIARLIWL